MELQLKERIVGATVIVALGIIIIPWLLDGPAQSSRPVEQAIELPPAEQAGRTYTIPLDPGGGPPVQIETGNGAQPVPTRPGAGAIQRPIRDEDHRTAAAPVEATPQPAEQPVQPPPRPAPTPVEQPPVEQPSVEQPPVQPPPRSAPTPVEQPAARTAPQASPTLAGQWTVQVGSFSQSDNAQALQRRLAAEGFEAFVSRVATDAGTMHRVRVGPVPQREAAEQLLTRLRDSGHGGGRVVRAED
jgi:DedD protein